MSSWGDRFNRLLRRGYDHGYAAFAADQGEKRDARKRRKTDSRTLEEIATEPVDWTRTDHHYYARIVGRFQFMARRLR